MHVVSPIDGLSLKSILVNWGYSLNWFSVFEIFNPAINDIEENDIVNRILKLQKNSFFIQSWFHSMIIHLIHELKYI